MTLAAYLPTPALITRETLTVLCGALLAAFILSQWPAGRAYIKAAWQAPTDAG